MNANETRKRSSDDNNQSGQRKRRKSEQNPTSNNGARKAGDSKNKGGSLRMKSNVSKRGQKNANQQRDSNAAIASTSAAPTPDVHMMDLTTKVLPKNYRKLDPPRPFPSVAPSVSATGPRSLHHEGKNLICVTRKTTLGAYLSRCKDIIMKDGYKSLQLHALGAAIPHLTMLAVSLPAILPYPRDQIHTEIETGTVDVHDEVIPTNEDEDISLRTRSKSTLIVKIKIGDGVDDRPMPGAQSNSIGAVKRGRRRRGGATKNKLANSHKGKEKEVVTGNQQIAPEQIIVREVDQDSDDDD